MNMTSEWKSDFTQISNFLIRDNMTNGNELKVYLDLLTYAFGEKETCFPSIATLSSDTGLSQNTIRTCLKSLEDKGYIKVQQRKKISKNGKEYNDTNLYTLSIPQHIKIRMIEEQKKKLEVLQNLQEVEKEQDTSKTEVPQKMEDYTSNSEEDVPQILKANNTNSNNINLNNTTTTTDKPEIQESKDVVDDAHKISLYYQNKIGTPLRPNQIEKLTSYLSKIPEVLVMEAIDRSINANTSSLGFIISTLDNWTTNGVYSIDALAEYESAWKQSKTGMKPENFTTKCNKFMNFKQTKPDFDEIEKLEMQRLKEQGIIS